MFLACPFPKEVGGKTINRIIGWKGLNDRLMVGQS